MPTGYTYMITEKNATFEQFVWACARGFGALVHMRDLPADAPIELPSESKYYRDTYEKIQEELKQVLALSSEEIQAKLKQEYFEAIARREEVIISNSQKKAQYMAILEKARAWNPPTPEHANLKKFMIEQVEESLNHDCSWVPEVPVLEKPEAWVKRRIVDLTESVRRYAQLIQGERQRYENVKKWVDDLKASVPFPKEFL